MRRLDGTGLYFYNARYYDPTIGRFISADPAPIPAGATAALDRYSYVYNNPLRYLDPSGLFVMFVNGLGTDDPEDTAGWAETDWAAVIRALGLVTEFECNGVNFQIVNEEFAFFQYGNGGSVFQSAVDAARDLDSQLQGKTDVKLIGFSKGGAVVMEYLAQMVEGNIATNNEIQKAITINSALAGDALSMSVGFERVHRVDHLSPAVDRLANLSSALNVGISNIVDSANIVGHEAIPGAQYIPLDSGDWWKGHNIIWGWPGVIDVHGIAQRNASEWAGQVKWR